jgi:hypothetical protein
MHYKPAAGMFVGGVTMSLCGPILGSASGYFATMAFARGDASMANVFMIVALFGGLLTLIGFIVLIVAIYRALVKIDALSTRTRSSDRDDWNTQQY